MLTVNRRDFIKTGGIITAGMYFLPACSSKIVEDVSYHFFTKDEGACVIALCEQIIPADNQFGGATDAGVVHYIDRHLSETFSEQAPIYRESLKKLQVHCHKEFGKAFQNLESDQQIGLMKLMESNKIDPESWKQPTAFFRLLHSHTMQGFYGSPIHGGNKNHMSFNMLETEGLLKIRLETPSKVD